MKRPKVAAIVPSAGYGRRLGAKRKKPFVDLGGKPLVSYALKTLDGCKAVDGIMIAAERSRIKRLKNIVKRFKIRKIIDVIEGGATRFESVRNCVKKISPSFDIVIIHDAARPFIDEETVDKSIKAAAKFGAAIVAVRESDTVKLAGGDLFVKDTLDRGKIFRAQTPQAFRIDIIKKAYSGSGGRVTDDAGLVERKGRVKIVEGSYRNLKITTKEDLKIAEALL
ncbi:MAG: 2-C-methyl-D-erythritol 4-phosphate cytidylyltransferase [Candidatus Omnitrophica bacterium]|nr:2-C-methyl-D-erythritol 4-phosphate cytidylyltransferase [Candidatus Omnitrophota bacterium]